jgi:hypothetical protein
MQASINKAKKYFQIPIFVKKRKKLLSKRRESIQEEQQLGVT